MLKALVDLGDVARTIAHPVLADVVADLDDARRLWRALDLDATERQSLSEDYVDLLTLHTFANAPARIARLEGHLERLRTLYATLAECEGRLCLMAHLRRQPRWCWAQASSGREVLLEEMFNPLLDASPAAVAESARRGGLSQRPERRRQKHVPARRRPEPAGGARVRLLLCRAGVRADRARLVEHGPRGLQRDRRQPATWPRCGAPRPCCAWPIARRVRCS